MWRGGGGGADAASSQTLTFDNGNPAGSLYSRGAYGCPLVDCEGAVMLDTIARGNAIRIGARATDPTKEQPVLITPTGGVTCRILNPDGTEKVAATAMTALDVGVYFLLQQTADSWQLGVYTLQVTSTHNGLVNVETGFFQLVAM